jgi:hypothetical protein
MIPSTLRVCTRSLLSNPSSIPKSLQHSSSLLPLSLCRSYATKPAATSTGGGRKKGQAIIGGDARYNLLKSVLYQAPPRDPLPITSTPQTPQEEKDANDVIEKTWVLYLEEKRREQVLALKKKYQSMRNAMLELEKTDKRLFDGTQVDVESTEEVVSYKRFPRRLRIPTETPPTSGWQSKV